MTTNSTLETPEPLMVWHNGCDWVVARGRKDAIEVMLDDHGADMDPSEIECDGWQMLPADKPLTVVFDNPPTEVDCNCKIRRDLAQRDAEKPLRRAIKLRRLLERTGQPGCAALVPTPRVPVLTGWLHNGHHQDCKVGSQTLTCAEWVHIHGRGFLCSTEY